LLAYLLALNYALLAQVNAEAGGMVLNHMHVKLERSTDKAMKRLG
jgi:hypothetical protein